MTTCIEECSAGSEKIIAGDFNARAIEARDEMESVVIKKFTLKGEKGFAGMGESAQDNRQRMINWCLEHGFKLDNTRFPKNVDNLATFRPPSCKPSQKISKDEHEQTDYIMTQQGNVRITDCETDTKSRLLTDHYPVIAEIKIVFREKREERKKTFRYNDRCIWKNKSGDKLNAILHELAAQNKLNDYAEWVRANEEVVQAHEQMEECGRPTSRKKRRN